MGSCRNNQAATVLGARCTSDSVVDFLERLDRAVRVNLVPGDQGAGRACSDVALRTGDYLRVVCHLAFSVAFAM